MSKIIATDRVAPEPLKPNNTMAITLIIVIVIIIVIAAFVIIKQRKQIKALKTPVV